MKPIPAAMVALLLCACGGSQGVREPMATMDARECLSRLQALRAGTEAARKESAPAQEMYRNNPSSFEAKVAVELALQRAARIGADNAREAERLTGGPCKGLH